MTDEPSTRETGTRRRPVVNALRCNACGLCAEECPAGAIRVTYVAVVRRDRCTGCGVCALTCPVEAVTLVPRASEGRSG